MIELHIIVAHPAAAPILVPLAGACSRRGTTWSVFFTGGGVEVLSSEAVRQAISGAREAVVCHDSWTRSMPGSECLVRLGSQTNNSEMVGKAARVISL